MTVQQAVATATALTAVASLSSVYVVGSHLALKA
jgi:hypothetical protein